MQMAEGRSRQLWDHTSEILALLFNGLLRVKGKPVLMPWQIHPYRRKERRKVQAETIGAKEGIGLLFRRSVLARRGQVALAKRQ